MKRYYWTARGMDDARDKWVDGYALYSDAVDFAASEREAGRKQEREEIVAELLNAPHWTGKYGVHSDSWKGGYEYALSVIRSREPGPKRLEKIDMVGDSENVWVTRSAIDKFNAAIEQVNANTEAIARMGGKT